MTLLKPSPSGLKRPQGASMMLRLGLRSTTRPFRHDLTIAAAAAATASLIAAASHDGRAAKADAARADAAADAGADLTAGEARVVALFQRCAPSVANIQTAVLRRESPLARNAVEVPAGTGSGFVWDDDGHVVTNYHVIKVGERSLSSRNVPSL